MTDLDDLRWRYARLTDGKVLKMLADGRNALQTDQAWRLLVEEFLQRLARFSDEDVLNLLADGPEGLQSDRAWKLLLGESVRRFGRLLEPDPSTYGKRPNFRGNGTVIDDLARRFGNPARPPWADWVRRPRADGTREEMNAIRTFERSL